MMRRLLWCVLILMLAAFALCGGMTWAIEVPARLAFGWIFYLFRTLPHIAVNLSGVALFLIALLPTAILGHRMAAWLWTGVGQANAWKWRWTTTGFAVVLLMFVAGIAATGVMHQTAWMIRSPEPLTTSNWSRRVQAERIRCASNLKMIVNALATYAKENDGYRPRDQADMIRIAAAQGVDAKTFVCPSHYADIAPGTQPADWIPLVASGESHCSYRYEPVPIVGPDGHSRVVIHDIDMHWYGGFGGINVVREDGEIEWFEREAASVWSQRLANDGPTTTPNVAGTPTLRP